MTRQLRHLIVFPILIVLGACTATYRGDVSSFHEMGVPGDKRVAITTLDEAKKDSIEFAKYAAVIGTHLQRQGYKQAGDNEPELIVFFDAYIDDGREEVRSSHGRHFGFGYSPFHYHSYFYHHRHFYDPFYNSLSDRSRTVYHAELSVQIRSADTGEVVFEGRAERDTYINSLPETLPVLAALLFEEFPGTSGETRRVVIKDEENRLSQTY